MLLWHFHRLVGKFLLRKAVSVLGYPEFSKHLFFFNEHLGGLSINYSVQTGRRGSQGPAVGISSKGWSLAGFEGMASLEADEMLNSVAQIQPFLLKICFCW